MVAAMPNDAAILKKVAALADTSALPEYQGLPTVSTSIAVTNTGDGLSQSMAVEPILYPVGTKRYVVIECEVDDHGYKMLPDGDAFHVKQKFKGGVALVVDADLVKSVVDEQRSRIQKAKDDAAGIMELPLDEPPDPDAETREPFPGDTPPADEVATRRRSKKATAKKAGG